MRFAHTTQLMLVADTYCTAVGLSRSRVSTLIFGDGTRLDGIDSGKDVRTRSFEHAMLWFSGHWPAGATWPEKVDRPREGDFAVEGAAA